MFAARLQGIICGFGWGYKPLAPDVYWLVRYAVEDDPSFEGEFETFEQFNQSIWDYYWANANAVFIATHQQTWVAMSGVHLEARKNNSTSTTLTGTARDHRGHGLAQAVKLLAINHAMQHDILELKTANDSRNTAMLAINQKLGFIAHGEFVWFERKI